MIQNDIMYLAYTRVTIIIKIMYGTGTEENSIDFFSEVLRIELCL